MKYSSCDRHPLIYLYVRRSVDMADSLQVYQYDDFGVGIQGAIGISTAHKPIAHALHCGNPSQFIKDCDHYNQYGSLSSTVQCPGVHKHLPSALVHTMIPMNQAITSQVAQKVVNQDVLSHGSLSHDSIATQSSKTKN